MTQYLETTAGKLYTCESGNDYIKFVEIGFCDEEGNHVPIAALEVKSKLISEDIDESAITRVLYNPNDDTDVKFEVVNK